MRISSLCCCLLLAAAVWAFPADDPAGMFLEAYQEYKAAEQLEIDGRLDDSLSKYRYCVSMLEQIRSKHPEYAPVVIEYRLRKSRESIGRVEGLKLTRPGRSAAPPAGPEGELPIMDYDSSGGAQGRTTQRRIPVTPADTPITQTPPSVARPGTTYRIPVPGASRPDPRVVAPTEPERTASSSTIRTLEVEIRALRAQLLQEQQKSDDLSRRLLETTARERSALHEVDRTKVHVVELKSQLAQTRQALDDARALGERLAAARDADASRIAGLETAVTEARADLEVAEEFNAELYTKLETAAEYIEASDKIRADLDAERMELAQRLEDDTSGEVLRLTAENESLSVEQEALATKVETLEGELADRVELEVKLADAEKKIKDLARLDPEREQLIADLRGELEAVNESLDAVNADLEAGKLELAALETQLAETVRTAEDSAAESAAENELLRGIVLRQLKAQATRQQARKLISEELEKLQIRSGTVIDQLDVLVNGEVALTDAEMELFAGALAQAETDAERSVDADERGPLNFTMVVAKSLGASDEDLASSDLNPDLHEDARQAGDLLGENRTEEARDVYASIVERAPESFYAVFKLGEAQHLLEDQDAAATSFRRALEIRPGDLHAQYGLGMALLRMGNPSDAAESFAAVVKGDPTNYRAHYFLGRALVEDGKLVDATREIERSLDLNPEYAPAHLNLAMLYATSVPPAKELARQHYEKATSLGASPDASIERLIQ